MPEDLANLISKLNTGLQKMTECINQGHPYAQSASPYHPRSNVIQVSCSNCSFPLYERLPTQEERESYENLMRTFTSI
jgi:hypothetical protein